MELAQAIFYRNLSIDKKFGIDNSEEMIDLAKSHHTDAELYVQDMIDFELDERFDLIIATADVLNYAPSKEDFLKVLNQAYKHLNENGILFLMFIRKRSLKQILIMNYTRILMKMSFTLGKRFLEKRI